MSSLRHYIEGRIDAISMYRIVLYALIFLTISSLALGICNLIPQSLLEQGISLLVVVAVCTGLNALIGRAFKFPVNHESALITALILFLLINPAQSLFGHHIIAVAAVLATVSKYLFAWRGQHIANPAAVGIMVLSIFGYYESTWWIATPLMFVPLLIAGLTVVYKIRKWAMVNTFIVTGFLVFLFEEWQFFGHIDNWSVFWLSYPALFLAFFMLTEPFTTPSTKRLQIMYAILIGFLAHTTLFASWFKMSPELALVIANVIFFPATLRRKVRLQLLEKKQIAADTFEWVFEKPSHMRYVAGQYMEWMLPHEKADRRGIRRYFTIASAPEDKDIRVAARYPAVHSSYKTALMALQAGDEIIASQRAGDFILPADKQKKIAMIAGGIGVTPFVAHVRSMFANNEWHNTILYYCNNTKADEAYGALWQQASHSGAFRYVPIFAKEAPAESHEIGYFSAAHAQKYSPDFVERIWYISGPPMMVDACESVLRQLGIPRKQIVKDFFPGLA